MIQPAAPFAQRKRSDVLVQILEHIVGHEYDGHGAHELEGTLQIVHSDDFAERQATFRYDLLTGATQQLVDDISCKIWARFIDKRELSYFQQRHTIISTRLLSGRTLIHAYSDDDPGDGFEEAIGDLEDVYFYHINTSNRRAAA